MTTKATLTIKLLKPHTHAGRAYPIGAELTMKESSARWLIAIGTATDTKAAKPREEG